MGYENQFIQLDPARKPSPLPGKAFMRKTGFHGSRVAALAKAVRPVIIQTYSYRENGFIGGNEAKEETGIVF